MNSRCSQMRDTLMDTALGKSPTPELAAHLESCHACSEQFDRQRALAHRIDGALHAAMSPQPTPQFVTRLRAARPTQGARPWKRRWWGVRVVGAVAGIAAIVAAVTLKLPPPTPATVALITRWQSPTAALLASPTDAFLDGRLRDVLDTSTVQHHHVLGGKIHA